MSKYLTEVENNIKCLVVAAKAAVMLRDVQLKTGKHEGRYGVIENIIPSAEHGLLFLIMVLRVDEAGYLNSDSESRAYRPRSDFTIIFPGE